MATLRIVAAAARLTATLALRWAPERSLVSHGDRA